MNKLYLRIPAHQAQVWPDAKLAYSLRSKDGSSMREGYGTLTELSNIIAKSSVVLFIAASDVTLLEITIPPIPEAKLRLALPNLIEDHLMSDSSECVLILASKNDQSGAANKRVVAVAERVWLQQLFNSFHNLGASHVKAVPAQLCLPYKKHEAGEHGEHGEVSARLEDDDQNLSANLALRFDADRGMGVLLESGQNVEDHLSMLSMLAPHGAIALELPKERVATYKTAVGASEEWSNRITVQESNWTTAIELSKAVNINLMSGINAAQTGLIQWQAWRWPAALAALVLLVNIVGLNSEYWSLKREAAALRLGIRQTYQVSFPKDTVVPAPLDQMRKNLGIAQRNAGQAAPYDFTVLVTEFGSAWSAVNSSSLPKLISVEYKEQGLMVQVKGSMPQEDIKSELARVNLGLKKINAETWQVRAQ